MRKKDLLILLRVVLIISFIITIRNVILIYSLATEYRFMFASRVITTIVGLGIVLAILQLSVLIISWTNKCDIIFHWLSLGYRLIKPGRYVILIVYLVILVRSPYILKGVFWDNWIDIPPPHRLLSFINGYFSNKLFWLSALWSIIVGGALLLDAAIPWRKWGFQRNTLYIFHLLLIGLVTKITSFLPLITNYPFNLTWSEGSRLYFVSTFFDNKIYGADLQLPFIDMSQHLLRTIPFFITGLPIWVHRLWEVMLWLGLTFLTSVLLAHRLRINSRIIRYIFIIWSFLFIFQGHVIYNLLVIVILIFWGFDRHRLWKSIIIIVIASIWAGLSRLNWMPMPGALAATLYFLETPVDKNKGYSVLKYLMKPISWFFLAVIVGYISLAAYISISGYDSSFFYNYRMNQDLLWYRLLPNSTYAPGIILGILTISLPIGILLIKSMQKFYSRWHFIRVFGLCSIIFVFFVGGLVVSAKVGGGTDLHNMDGFLILLLTIGGYLYFGSFITEAAENWQANHSWRISLFILVLPVAFALVNAKPVVRRNYENSEHAINNINAIVSDVVDQGRRVLFIDHRQLITFGYIQSVPLISNYEKVVLTEMAMARNEDYLNNFFTDIQSHEYCLIVSQRLFDNIKQEGIDPQAEENNLFVNNISIPILNNYTSVFSNKVFGIEILEPSDKLNCE
ncbi:MAG: hypothetical protein FVQ83_01470 [Chloroflexi bacterium]|nr:hypothetical protein [Chloroflexota bacterium]